jgi:hypothetical protein
MLKRLLQNPDQTSRHPHPLISKEQSPINSLPLWRIEYTRLLVNQRINNKKRPKHI